MDIRVQEEPFDAGAELAAFSRGRHDIGAIVTFSGLVRDDDGGLEYMEIEHYPGMTTRAITASASTVSAPDSRSSRSACSRAR